jgi:hypothetical protein
MGLEDAKPCCAGLGCYCCDGGFEEIGALWVEEDEFAICVG